MLKFISKIVIMVVILITLLDLIFKDTIEGFNDSIYLLTHTQFPWYNTQIGTKRGMSYDIRGDIPPMPDYIGPWNISPHFPIMNKPLAAVS